MTSAIEPLARAGYSARGLVYLIVGFFAALAAMGNGEAKDSEGALRTILAQPFGTILVWLMVVGLAGYAVWRLVQAIRDPDGIGSGAKGLAVRAGLFVSALTHIALALFAVGLVSTWGGGGGGGGGSDPTAEWLAVAFDAGYAQVVVWLAAAVAVAVGCAFVWKGWTQGFEKYFRCPEHIMRWLRPVASVGLVARGVVFFILAVLIVTGGFAYNAESRPGLEDALEALQGFAFGWLILLVVAFGLVAFGVYSLAEARYRHIEVH